MPKGLALERLGHAHYQIHLSDPIGTGSMDLHRLSPHVMVGSVDYHCARCPNPTAAMHKLGLSEDGEGTWFTVNLCLEGRCEVIVSSTNEYAVVHGGQCCISRADSFAEEYRYPLGHYRGIELIAHTNLVEDEVFSLLRDEDNSFEASIMRAGIASIYTDDPSLTRLMKAIEQNLHPFSKVRLLYDTIGLLLDLYERDLSGAPPMQLLTKSQMDMARLVQEEIEDALDQPHDARLMAARFGVGTSTLIGYFENVYGQTIASYLRTRRLEEAGKLIEAGVLVTDAANAVGYTNPSKFSAAFRKQFGVSPTEYRRLCKLNL